MCRPIVILREIKNILKNVFGRLTLQVVFGLFSDTVIDDNFGVQDFREEPMVAIVDGDDDGIAGGDILAL